MHPPATQLTQLTQVIQAIQVTQALLYTKGIQATPCLCTTLPTLTMQLTRPSSTWPHPHPVPHQPRSRRSVVQQCLLRLQQPHLALSKDLSSLRSTDRQPLWSVTSHQRLSLPSVRSLNLRAVR
jgi:hypothetical protein